MSAKCPFCGSPLDCPNPNIKEQCKTNAKGIVVERFVSEFQCTNLSCGFYGRKPRGEWRAIRAVQT